MEENKIEIKISDSASIQEKKISGESHWLDKVSFISLFSCFFLLPLFFLPSKFISFEFTKIFIVVLGTLISMIFWSLSRIKEGKFELPSTILFPSAFFVIFIYFLSSLFSGNKANSFIGHGFELGTFGLIFIGFAFMFLTSSVFKTRNKIFYSYIALFISFIVVSLFQTLRLLFGADFLSFGIFKDITFNLVGKWNDLGIYFGLIAILSITTLQFTKLAKTMRFFLLFASLVSLFYISLINLKIVWFLIILFALLFFIYSISLRRGKMNNQKIASAGNKKTFYLISFFLAMSMVFVADGFRSKHIISDSISSYFKISHIEVRPSFQGTSQVLKSSFKENPILGSGPGNFLNSWLKFKPDGVNNTVFWNFDFIYGVGIIPTFVTTTGILGMLSWFIFFGSFLYVGFKYIFVKTENSFSHYLTVSSFLGSFYLWTINIFYVPSSSIFFLTFFFTGIFIGSLVNEDLVRIRSFVYLGNPRRSLISMPILVILIISSITGSYIYFQRFVSYVYFQKSVNSLNMSGNLDDAERYAKKAISFSKIDSYYRLLSDIYLSKLTSLSSQEGISSEALVTKLEPVFKNAVESSKSAIDYNNTNYQNYLSFGRVYESVMPVDGAYKIALENYNKALELNPRSPLINLMLARLESSNKNNTKAREYIIKSIQLKNNYTDAVFSLAQIEIAEGNIKDAIKIVEAGSALTFDNPVVYFQLGILKYSEKEKDYKGAAEAFEKALSINSSYSNARYFLGLSYYNLGKTNEAIKQFEAVQSLNPDNKEVELILKNLREGRAPFTNAEPPIDDKPEKRKSLPVKDDETKETKTR